MTLDQDDIKSLAAALAPLLVQQLRAAEGHMLDAEYLVTLPIEERRKRSRALIQSKRAAMKSGGSK